MRSLPGHCSRFDSRRARFNNRLQAALGIVVALLKIDSPHHRIGRCGTDRLWSGLRTTDSHHSRTEQRENHVRTFLGHLEVPRKERMRSNRHGLTNDRLAQWLTLWPPFPHHDIEWTMIQLSDSIIAATTIATA